MTEVYLLTGGNLGNRMEYLAKAKEQIEKKCGVLLLQSSVYETAAWGNEDQGAFLNQVLQIETELTAGKLLQAIFEIENNLGRKREMKYGPRTIDIDILFYGDAIVEQKGLKIPHPKIQNRRFVLTPLQEIAADKVHPVLFKTITRLLNECPDPLEVNKIN